MRTFLATVIVAALWLPVDGQTPSRTPSSVADRLAVVETWVDAQLAWERIPGMSVALVHDQQVVWSKGFGWADVERRRPAAPDTIYSICSISKLFTSTAVMQLRDRGTLSLDAPVAEYLPWMQIRQRFPDGPEITLRGILAHSDVFVIDGELHTLSMPTDDPAGGLTRLKPDGDHTFRRVRDDGKLAETVTFELGPDGQVHRMVRNSNYSIRVR